MMTHKNEIPEEVTVGSERGELDVSDNATMERRRDFIDPRKKARRYQLEVLYRALEENTIIFLETGCGKTLIAVLLIDALSHRIRKPSLKVCVFLAPNKALVDQQAKEIEEHTDLRVGKYWGSMEGDTWNHTWWREQIVKYEVIVMTPQILFNNLHHCFFTMGMIELMIFDECHHAQKKHPYANIMRDFYHSQRKHRPKIFGMTASPIIGKVDGGGVQQISENLNKLESMLDAKVYTLKDRMELEKLLPNPLEQIWLYEPSYASDSAKELNSLLQGLRSKFMRSHEEVGNPKDLLLHKKQMEEVAAAYRSLEYCIYELGAWCTKKAAELLMEKDGQHFEAGVPSAKQTFVQEALSVFHAVDVNALDAAEGNDEELSSGSPLTKMMSSKLLCLLRVLLDFRDNFQKCIIFVERVVATKVLSSLFSHLRCLSFLRCLPLVGSQSMSQKSQQQTIEKFRSGEVNLLVATGIAEEGLDIQSCSMVIRFDAPKTNRSFIQSRGRARQLGSNYVVLVERGNVEQFNSVVQLREKEKLMWELTADRRDLPVLLMEPENFDVEVFKVDSTGAVVTTDYSVPLLCHYCSKLPGDQFYRPAPEFSFSEVPGGVVCEVRLPSTAPVQVVRGHVCATKTMAKRVAALECCKKLHEAGVLTDYLVPASELEGDGMDERDDPTKLSLKADSMVELHATLIPKALHGQWADAPRKVRLFAYAFHITAEPQDREYADYALFLEADLEDNITSTATELYLTKGRVAKVQLVPIRAVEFDVNQLKDAQLFQERTLSTMLDRNTKQKKARNLSSPTQAYWDPRRLYLLLPVVPGSSGSLSVDWASIYDVLSDIPANVSPSLPDIDIQKKRTSKHIEEKPEAWDCRSLSKLCGVFQTADGPVPVETVVNSLVETVYNGKLYCVVDVLWDMNGASRFVYNSSQFPTYIDYYKKRYKLDLVYQKQPLLKVKSLLGMRNLIVKRPEKDPGLGAKAEMLVELPPEFCSVKVLGFPTKAVNTLSLIPSFMHRLEFMLIACELQEKLKDAFSEASKVSSMTVLQALTTATCLESLSLERLELFGDSFLKFAVSKRLFLVYEQKDEGQLTNMRQRVICNSFLHKLGVEKELPLHIHDEHFQPRDWAAPGRPSRLTCDESNCTSIHALHDATDASKVNQIKCSEGHRWLQKKTVADVVEAFIGAHLVDGGPDAALAFMDWVGIEVDFDPELITYASARCVGDVRFIQGIDLSKLEEVLGYTFQNKAILVEALTHSSYQVPFGNCYQRLEFLGDAVLDYLITSHLYETFPDLPPGLLTDLRSATASNECFARVAIRKNLQQYLLHDSSYLEEEVRKFVLFIDGVSQGREAFYGWECNKGPKVLGDLVESLAGAVLVDTGFDPNKVWEVFEPLLQPIVTPDTLHLHPVRELVELCNREKFELDHSSTERKKLRVVTFTVTVKESSFVTEAAKGDKKSAKRLAAYQALEELRERGFEHRYRTLAKTLVSQGRIGPRKSPLEGGSSQEFIRSDSQRDGRVLVQPPSHDHSSTVECNVLSQKTVEKSPRKAEKNDQDLCEKVALKHDLDLVRLESSCSFSHAKHSNGTLNDLDSVTCQEQRDTGESSRSNFPSLIPSTGDYSVDTCKDPNVETLGMSIDLFVDGAKEGSTQDNGLPVEYSTISSIPKCFEEEQGFLSSEENSSSCTFASSDYPPHETDQFVTEVLRVTERDTQVARSGTSRDFASVNEIFMKFEDCDNDTWLEESILSKAEKQQQPLKVSSSLDPLRSESKLDGSSLQHVGFSDHADIDQGIDAEDGIICYDYCGVEHIPDEALTSQSVQELPAEFLVNPLTNNNTEPIYTAGEPRFLVYSELPAHAMNSASSTSCGPISSGSLPRTKPSDEYVGRAREELHNICAKNKWEMPVYVQRDRQGPPHAPRFTYMVSVKFHTVSSEFEIECEGESMRDTKRAMDSAASQAVAWLRQEVLGRA